MPMFSGAPLDASSNQAGCFPLFLRFLFVPVNGMKVESEKKGIFYVFFTTDSVRFFSIFGYHPKIEAYES